MKVEWKNETGLGVWTGEDLKDIIWLMVYTGYRISDATFFNISRLQGNQVFIRAKKNGGDVFAVWRRRIAKAFEVSGKFEEPPTPHRFRHTFARMLLEKGVPVADLLGDDEKTVREHYARWVPERQARLTKILQDALDGRPKLAAIQGGRA